MPAYTCRTEGMALGRSPKKALKHLLANPEHRVVERRIVTTQLRLVTEAAPVQPSPEPTKVFDFLLREAKQ